MKKLLIAASLAAMVFPCSTPAQCRTLSFDDVPSGTDLLSSSLYTGTYRVRFKTFHATDHSGATWGTPFSAPNVAACSAIPAGGSAQVNFGIVTPSVFDPDFARTVGAHFSTDTGAVVTMTAYHPVQIGGINYSEPVISVTIGAPGQSWDNVYMEITSPDVPFNELMFRGVSSPNDLLGFCMDDMTITYVPEPSSLLALCAGIGAMGAVIRRRRR